MPWPSNRTEFGPNRTPVLIGLSSADDESIIPVAVDPTDGAILISGGGGGGGGTSSDFGAAFPTAGTAIGVTDGTDMQPLTIDDFQNLNVNVNNPSPLGVDIQGQSGADPLDVTDSALADGSQLTQIVDNGGNSVGTSSTGGGNALLVDGSNVTQPVSGTVTATTTLAAAIADGDGIATQTTAPVIAYPVLFNGGTTFDRMRGGQGDGAGSTGLQDVVGRLYNGSTYDRMRGDATDGTWVNVKTSILPTGAALESGGNLATLAGGVSSSKYQMNYAQIVGNTVSTDVGGSGNGTARVVQANNAGKTLKSAAGSASSSGNNTLVSAGTNKLKVYAFSLTTTSTTAVTCIFEDGASGTALWEVVLQAPTSVNVGANLAVSPPAYLFAGSTATLLNLNLSGAQTVIWSVAYYDEA